MMVRQLVVALTMTMMMMLTMMAYAIHPSAASSMDSSAVSSTFSCSSDLDCSLNGVCMPSNKTCNCDPIWKGDACDTLALVPTSIHRTPAYGFSPNVSTWGGNALRADDGQWHFWVSEFAEGCGLTFWKNNSFVAHAVGPTPTGPFKRVGSVALGIFSHNVVPIRAPASFGTGARPFYLFHIGRGSTLGPPGKHSPNNCSALGPAYSAYGISGISSAPSSPSSPAAINNMEDPPTTTTRNKMEEENNPIAPGDLMHRAPAPDGPWEPLPSMDPPCNNPAPLWHPNGTLYVGCNIGQGQITVWSSSNGGFTWTSVGNIIPPATWKTEYKGLEDPFLYLDVRGAWHLLLHRYDYLNGRGSNASTNLVSGHAFSLDGHKWHFSDVQPYTSELQHTDAPPTLYTSLERPKLLWGDDRGFSTHPTHLVVAASPMFTSPCCAGCATRLPEVNSSCVLCKLTKGIDWTHTLILPLPTANDYHNN